jgi:hypothetical protein
MSKSCNGEGSVFSNTGVPACVGKAAFENATYYSAENYW